MAMTLTLIEAAMNTNIANPNDSQAVQNARLAQAIVDTIKTATLTYTTGLISGTPGSPVTGVMTGVVIS